MFVVSMVVILLIPFVPMFLTIVYCGLIALEDSLVNPLQALLLIDGYALTFGRDTSRSEESMNTSLFSRLIGAFSR